MTGETRWSLIAEALTGEPLEVPDVTQAAGLLAALAGRGYPSDRIAETARAAAEAGRVWPFPVAQERLRSVGAASFQAALREALRLLALDGLRPTAPSNRTSLNADEQRLLREVPPHHGA